jgi:hypothetical protein
MSEQKPKIDLKARLGKKPMSSPMGSPPGVGGSIPPPVGGTGNAGPAPMAAPTYTASPRPVTASGVPAPPFTNRPQPSAVQAPRVDPTNPYAAVAPSVVAARPAQQAIRIEIGEEVHAARRSGRKKIAVLAFITALVGGFVGFTIGGGAERAKGAESAVEGAQQLVKDIQAANAEVQKLADTLKAAKEKLGKGQFPEQEVGQLGAINIPFKGANLAGKGIGRFQGEVVSMLIEYTNATTEANDQKEKVQNVLAGTKKGILELLEAGTKPQVRWAVQVADGPGGPWASMMTVPAPFPARDKWPDELKVGPADKQQTLKRYSSGNPAGGYFIAVDPGSQSAVCPSDVIFKLRRELNDLETTLRGDNTPGEERTGIIESGQKLVERLKKIGSS